MKEEEKNESIKIEIHSIDLGNDSMSFSRISNSFLNNPIFNLLIEFGYNINLSKKLITFLQPNTIEQAIEYLSEVNGIIQHTFIFNSSNENQCSICNKTREQHLRDNININFLDNLNNYSLNTVELKKDEDYLSKSVSIKEISIATGKIEKTICPICDEEYTKSNKTKVENCSDSFCQNCWLSYLKVNIIEKKKTKIKCMSDCCNEILSEKFIYTIIKIDRNLIEKYNENKLREEILNNPNKKFCPFPNCNSYSKRKSKEEKIVKCGNGHSFCFNCLKKPHGDLSCDKKIDESMEEYAKKQFIKRCPNCKIWTEKNKGCNHITCIECSYQWCWLCNQKYTENHFSQGKCNGFQFFNPKNEEEIQLAFEGKININEDDDDFLNDSFGFPQIHRIDLNDIRALRIDDSNDSFGMRDPVIRIRDIISNSPLRRSESDIEVNEIRESNNIRNIEENDIRMNEERNENESEIKEENRENERKESQSTLKDNDKNNSNDNNKNNEIKEYIISDENNDTNIIINILYFLFGQILIINSTKIISYYNINRFNSIYKITVFLIGFANTFFHIYVNILLFILYIFKYGIASFQKELNSIVKDFFNLGTHELVYFKEIYDVILDCFNILFFGFFSLIIYYLKEEFKDFFSSNFCHFYVLIVFLIDIIIFFISLLSNIVIIIIFLFIYRKNCFEELKFYMLRY